MSREVSEKLSEEHQSLVVYGLLLKLREQERNIVKQMSELEERKEFYSEEEYRELMDKLSQQIENVKSDIERAKKVKKSLKIELLLEELDEYLTALNEVRKLFDTGVISERAFNLINDACKSKIDAVTSEINAEKSIYERLLTVLKSRKELIQSELSLLEARASLDMIVDPKKSDETFNRAQMLRKQLLETDLIILAVEDLLKRASEVQSTGKPAESKAAPPPPKEENRETKLGGFEF